MYKVRVSGNRTPSKTVSREFMGVSWPYMGYWKLGQGWHWTSTGFWKYWYQISTSFLEAQYINSCFVSEQCFVLLVTPCTV